MLGMDIEQFKLMCETINGLGEMGVYVILTIFGAMVTNKLIGTVFGIIIFVLLFRWANYIVTSMRDYYTKELEMKNNIKTLKQVFDEYSIAWRAGYMDDNLRALRHVLKQLTSKE